MAERIMVKHTGVNDSMNDDIRGVAGRRHARLYVTVTFLLGTIYIDVFLTIALFARGIMAYGKQIDQNHAIQENRVLIKTNDSLQVELLQYAQRHTFKADVTVYQNIERQTDSTPFELADGTKLDRKFASHIGTMRHIAVSRDLHERWGGTIKFGDYIFLENAGPLTGFWRVSDVMGKYYTRTKDGTAQKIPIRNSLDCLTDINQPNDKYYGVTAYLFPSNRLGTTQTQVTS